MNTSAQIIELITRVGMLTFAVVTGLVLFFVVVSAADRHPRGKSRRSTGGSHRAGGPRHQER